MSNETAACVCAGHQHLQLIATVECKLYHCMDSGCGCTDPPEGMAGYRPASDPTSSTNLGKVAERVANARAELAAGDGIPGETFQELHRPSEGDEDATTTTNRASGVLDGPAASGATGAVVHSSADAGPADVAACVHEWDQWVEAASGTRKVFYCEKCEGWRMRDFINGYDSGMVK